MNTIKLPVFIPFRALAMFFAVVMLFVSTALPASAASFFNSNHSTSAGEAHLDEIQKRAEDIAERSSPLSLDEVQERTEAAQGGLNEVQGAADKDKMSRPENSKNSTTVLDKIEEGLDKASK